MQSVSDLRTQCLSLAGIRVDALQQRDLIDIVKQAIESKDRLLILNHNLHSLYLHETDPEFSKIYLKASWVYIDGLPVVWLGQFAGLPVTSAHRITFLDSFGEMLSEASRNGWRVFYLGSSEQVLAEGLALLRGRYPDLMIDGHHGFFEKLGPENDRVISQINEFNTDVLFVGMGMPIQEMWVAQHTETLNVSAILTSGATLDYITGHAYRPPAWAGPLGLYGGFRLCSDPKRLWRRYLLEPIILMKHLFLRLVRQRINKNKDKKVTVV
jgi:N-acetylglucosaminyldiphosphoundecaprenol N-acetyl-beta-D-mannosaminyltransferase